MTSRAWWYAAAIWLALAVLLPVVGHRWRNGGVNRCAFDGARINPARAVAIDSKPHGLRQFCSLACAENWLQRSKTQPLQIWVTDESTGEQLDASEAFYVRSQVLAHAPTRDRRHVFGDLAAAQRHAEQYLGRLLERQEQPFARWSVGSTTHADRLSRDQEDRTSSGDRTR